MRTLHDINCASGYAGGLINTYRVPLNDIIHPKALHCAGGDLYEALKLSGGQISERRAVRDVLRPCLSALIYLHAKVAMLPGCLPAWFVPYVSRCMEFLTQVFCHAGDHSQGCQGAYPAVHAIEDLPMPLC